MKHKIHLLILLLAWPYCQVNNAKAQTIVQKFEGEARLGITVPLGNFHDFTSPQVGASLGLEARYNFKGTPWDCGVLLELSTARWGYNELINDGHDHWQSNRTLAFAAVTDYNFRQGKKINPFVGTGLGIASLDVVGDEYYPSSGISLFIAPRVGIEFLRHIRLTTQFNISKKGAHNFEVTLGFVIGGRPKK